ncbi:MAG: fluoride efflux transporter CrcB [Pseudomonadales bacterium]|jgi:CrcB protein|nr:fluoride efflux transporter CrcB [Pseudomonadales bacterium]
MQTYLFVALGGSCGACFRYWLYNAHPILQQKTGLATWLINVSGSFLMGLVFIVVTERSGLSPHWRSLIGVGFLGAYTTYSTYSLDALQLLQRGDYALALLYLLGTMLACLLAVGAGYALGRLLL